jgi:hypothetical protein
VRWTHYDKLRPCARTISAKRAAQEIRWGTSRVPNGRVFVSEGAQSRASFPSSTTCFASFETQRSRSTKSLWRGGLKSSNLGNTLIPYLMRSRSSWIADDARHALANLGHDTPALQAYLGQPSLGALSQQEPLSRPSQLTGILDMRMHFGYGPQTTGSVPAGLYRSAQVMTCPICRNVHSAFAQRSWTSHFLGRPVLLAARNHVWRSFPCRVCWRDVESQFNVHKHVLKFIN